MFRCSWLSRSIPACAGEPISCPCRTAAWTVYPRVCGGAKTSRIFTRGKTGLSPRVRGSQARAAQNDDMRRSIPACAGEPRRCRVSGGRRRVYPRVCGGANMAPRRGRYRRGLSPRVRGSRVPTIRPRSCRGSIPACAGEPFVRVAPAIRPPVYPRVCGGASRAGTEALGSQGLSPRVRGSRGMTKQIIDKIRSIPACAGEPWCPPCRFAYVKVYPRVCGGAEQRGCPPTYSTGLSPRVRGSPTTSSSASARTRSIPACAGEPVVPCPPARLDRVYPRVCGGA